MTRNELDEYNELKDFLITTYNSGHVDVRVVIAKMATLVGLPAFVMTGVRES